MSDSVIVPKGTYYLGDPCYSVPDELWDELLQDSDYFNKPSGTVAGHTVYAFGTKYGDGVYQDKRGREYPVDAGLIGLVPEALATKEMPLDLDFAHLIRFDHPTICSDNDGVLKFGHIIIDTNDEEDEPEDEWWQEDEEDEDEDEDDE